ncbi:MAG: YdeI/OmpD-associated family protein [Chthoniobacteraceae bacterium]
MPKSGRPEFEKLRAIVLGCGLTEELKWGQPCYTTDGSNIVIIHGFKEYCALLFCKGALLKDPRRILIQQTENVQAARQLRFTSLGEIEQLEATIASYLKEAVAAEAKGMEVTYKKTADFAMPGELRQKLDADPKLQAAFTALTPGRQRGYLLYFASAKQSKTREARIEKCRPKIFKGKGWNEE